MIHARMRSRRQRHRAHAGRKGLVSGRFRTDDRAPLLASIVVGVPAVPNQKRAVYLRKQDSVSGLCAADGTTVMAAQTALTGLGNRCSIP